MRESVGNKRQIKKEFKEFKEFKERSQNPGVRRGPWNGEK
jgi:hypothetical protein